MRIGPPLALAAIVALAAVLAGAAAGASTEDPLDLVEVPEGAFTMGADKARDPLAFDNERWSPTAGEGTVVVPSFFIAKRPVTVAEFAAFARAGRWKVDARAVAGDSTAAAAFVSWPDALAYCRWLETALTSSASGSPRLRALLAAGWRVTLPTEAEWEKAATVIGRPQFEWGTVAEWTRSPYQPYPYNPDDDRANLEADALWVIRGGVFGDGATPRVTARTGADPGARRPFIGFRVAVTRR